MPSPAMSKALTITPLTSVPSLSAFTPCTKARQDRRALKRKKDESNGGGRSNPPRYAAARSR